MPLDCSTLPAQSAAPRRGRRAGRPSTRTTPSGLSSSTHGASAIDDLSLAELWKAAAAGNRKAQFHTELAATEESGGPYRVGVGLSRTAQTLLAAIGNGQYVQTPGRSTVAAGQRRGCWPAGAPPNFERRPGVFGIHGRLLPAQAEANGRTGGDDAHRRRAPGCRGCCARLAAETRVALAGDSHHSLRQGRVLCRARGGEKARAWVHQKPAAAADLAAAAIARAQKRPRRRRLLQLDPRTLAGCLNESGGAVGLGATFATASCTKPPVATSWREEFLSSKTNCRCTRCSTGTPVPPRLAVGLARARKARPECWNKSLRDRLQQFETSAGTFRERPLRISHPISSVFVRQ